MSDKIRINNDTDFGEAYEPTDSDEEYSEEEKELLANVRKGRRRNADVGDREVLQFDESDDSDDEDAHVGADDDEDDVAELMRDSDIEGAEDNDDDLPDTKNWGNKRRNYYNTDFVDPDYSSYNAQEEELAKAEEEEAKKIQLRLAKQMNEADFLLDDDDDDADYNVGDGDDKEKADSTEQSIKIKADLTGLTKRERLQLFYKDSPEFHGLTKDFQSFLNDVEQLIAPVMRYTRTHNVPQIPALGFAKVYGNILMTFCTNVAYYLLLKSKRLPVKNHPVIKRLVQLQQLLQQLQDKFENIIRPQLEALLERIENGDKFEVRTLTVPTVPAKRSKLRILDEYSGEATAAPENEQSEEEGSLADDDDDDDAENDSMEEDATEADDDVRRGITYQIAKNKGLTPHRKKEQRNPRVKHRGKYRKALIRRKGAVRTVRKEMQRYGGEKFGIKSTVSKSVKFKS